MENINTTHKYKKFYNRIIKNKKIFDKLVLLIQKNNILLEQKILLAEQLLNILTYNQTGYFYSNILEKFFVEIAKQYDIANYNINYKPKSVLHVMTQCYEHGGHTRVVERWIDNTKRNYINSVVLLKQNNDSIPELLKKNIKNSKGELIVLEQDMTLVERALKLREIAMEYEYIVLHTHMEDPTATVAFGTEKFTRPVLFFNHADHMFWIGKTISDMILDIRTQKSISPKYRDINDAVLCPIPCDFVEDIFYEKKEARKSLGIDLEEKIILTSGSNFKFTPIGNDSIFDVYEEILSKNPKVKLIVIGKNKYWNRVYKKFKNRVELYKEIPYQKYLQYVSAADLVIDSYPMNGETTLIDAVKANVPFLSLDVICSGQNDYIIESQGYCLNKKELIEKALKCLCDANYSNNILQNEFELFNKNYSKENWVNNIEKLYSEAPKKHKLRPIPETKTPCFIDDYSVVLERLYRKNKIFKNYGIPYLLEIREIKVPNCFKIYIFILFGINIFDFKKNISASKKKVKTLAGVGMGKCLFVLFCLICLQLCIRGCIC